MHGKSGSHSRCACRIDGDCINELSSDEELRCINGTAQDEGGQGPGSICSFIAAADKCNRNRKREDCDFGSETGCEWVEQDGGRGTSTIEPTHAGGALHPLLHLSWTFLGWSTFCNLCDHTAILAETVVQISCVVWIVSICADTFFWFNTILAC